MAYSSTSQYEFINAKLRARIGLMRESHLIDDLMKANSVVEAVHSLRDGSYKDVAKAYDETGDLQQMELVLLKKEIEMYHGIAKLLRGSTSDFVRTLLGKIEVENLKNAIRLWFSSVIRLHSIRYRSEYLFKEKIVSDINWTGLINAVSWDGVVSSLGKSPYAAVLRNFSQEDIQQQGVFYLESALDCEWYRQILEKSEQLSPVDRKIVQEVFKVEIDLNNILMLIRFGWYHKLDKEHLQSLLFPWGRIYRSNNVKTFLAMSPGDRDPVVLLQQYYPDLVESIQKVSTESKEGAHSDELLAKATLKIEHYLQQKRSKEYHYILAGDPFTIGIALAYFFLYTSEDSMIKAILNGKYYGYSEEYIRGVLA
ncbi:archaeal/vacuolar-type H+-ATPase subunit C [Sphaerochaeta pleomorpha str. Grapes]|uniref:Archaeal/vacuolar-type H+-ATPase subunit C n=1 Tax=Sphaerochaeta pleomorpha (strain ATCC BAA-1885 / DSM 22778 / Grapes) TaxID=158190 RepID=G8QYL6_SPHPG|nr:V-type ATPase subunit [Sphaerochaeta pleomorpha]AEV28579.1 archaeal/vacuolar-type H+-ATPase subunit C [Sphaerochaeta pleomorpha str. Grapes]